MADEATDAGNDQSSEDKPQTTGEGQQAEPQTVEYMGRQLTPEQLKSELENTNAYVTKLQQEKAQATQPKADEQPSAQELDNSTDNDLALQGYTPEQIKQARDFQRKLTGVDKLEKELAEFRKDREQDQKQQTFQKVESAFDALSKEFGDAGVPVPKTDVEKQTFIDEAVKKGYNPLQLRGYFLEKNFARLQKPAEQPKAATSDKSDTAPEMNESKYREALKSAGGDPFKIAQVETEFKGNPTQGAWE